MLTFINSQSASPLDISAGTPCEIYNYIYYIIITMTIIIKIGIAAPLNSALPVGSIQPQLHPPPIPTPCFILRANLVFPTQVHVAKEIATWPPQFNPLNPELNPICYLLALLWAHHFLHISRIRVKLLTFRRLMSYIYGAPILDVSRSHTTTQHSR